MMDHPGTTPQAAGGVVKPQRMVQIGNRRAVPEWVGAHPDADIPKHVKLRIWDRCEGRCHITGKKIRVGDKWQFEHIVSLRNNGEHRELNIAPALDAPHAEKSAKERTDGAKADRTREKFLGIFPKSPTPLRSRNSFRKRQSQATGNE